MYSLVNPCCVRIASPLSLWSLNLFVNLEQVRYTKSGIVDTVSVIYIANVDISCIELELSKYLFNCIYLCIRLDNHKICLLFLCTYCLVKVAWAYFMGKSKFIVKILPHNLEMIEHNSSFSYKVFFFLYVTLSFIFYTNYEHFWNILSFITLNTS